MSAACRQILIDRIDDVDKLRRELEKDIAALILNSDFESAIEDALSHLEQVSDALVCGLLELDSSTRVQRPETPPMDPKVLR